MNEDPRLTAFCHPGGQDVFHSVIHHQEVWRPDPLDVPTIHAQAREAYQRLLDRVKAGDAVGSGRILLLGESGAGKTHLMRVFRNATHEQAQGYFSYLQMTSAADDYPRYVLNNILDSLDKPYYEPAGDTTGLMRLSNTLAENPEAVSASDLATLREEPLNAQESRDLIYGITDRLVALPRFQNQDLDLMRSLLYLQRQESATHRRVLNYLHCRDLSEWDRQALGGITPRTQPDDPERMVHALARLVHGVDGAAFVLCLDQLEELHAMEDAAARFRRAIQTLVTLGEIPNAVVVISCLSDFYKLLREHLYRSHIDRLERDPVPEKLSGQRSRNDITELLGRRLAELCSEAGVPVDPEQPLYPFPPDTPDRLAGQPTRIVIDWAKRQRDKSIETGHPPIHDDEQPPPPPDIDLQAKWNDTRMADVTVPTGTSERLLLIAWAVERVADEVPQCPRPEAELEDEGLTVRLPACEGSAEDCLYVALCEKAAQGGGLIREVEALRGTAGARRPVALRSTEFPKSPKTKVAQQLGEMLAQGGRRVSVGDSDWRTMVAMRGFAETHGNDPSFADWVQSEKPLSGLPALRHLLDLDNRPARPPVPPEGEPGETKPVPPPPETGDLVLGLTREHRAHPLTLPPGRLLRHAAYLGGSGSGKTTLALGLVEQLLLRGVPAVLLDRKGDLCRYADPAVWKRDLGDPERNARLERLREKVDVALYTPGAPAGRPLGISVAPPGLGALSRHERIKLANLSAAALGGMMGLKPSGKDKQSIAILGQAIAVLSEIEDASLTLPGLTKFIDSQDPSLINAIGRLDPKLFKGLVENLEALRLMNGGLFATDREVLNTAALLSPANGRTPLSVISTASLGDNANTLFWVAQFLLDLSRYCAHHPAQELQAVVLLDEADLYLPAQGKPATKEPLEGLLKRARSAGVCLMLATQSPADLDYKSRDQVATWFLGRIKETTAINKLKPMLSEAKTDVSGKLAGQTTGDFFAVQEGEVTAFKGNLSLVRAEQVPAEDILLLARQ